jgi:hypothetical protein
MKSNLINRGNLIVAALMTLLLSICLPCHFMLCRAVPCCADRSLTRSLEELMDKWISLPDKMAATAGLPR